MKASNLQVGDKIIKGDEEYAIYAIDRNDHYTICSAERAVYETIVLDNYEDICTTD